jgi:hypothetical protein
LELRGGVAFGGTLLEGREVEVGQVFWRLRGWAGNGDAERKAEEGELAKAGQRSALRRSKRLRKL